MNKNGIGSEPNTEGNTENQASSSTQRPPTTDSQRPQSAVSSQRPTSAASERIPPKKNAVIPIYSDNRSIVSNKSKGNVFEMYIHVEYHSLKGYWGGADFFRGE